MTKQQILYPIIAVTLLLVSCTADEPTFSQDEVQQLTISVTDGGYTSADGKTTRAVENGYTTEFTEGDACGLFMTRGLYKDKKMIYSNVKLTAERDASTGKLTWKPEAGTTLAGGLSDEECYLYYPYRADLDNIVDISKLLNTIQVDPQYPFFNALKSNWPVKYDQSSYADYAASDLMTASCTSTLENGKLRLDFVMAHEFPLVVIEMPKTVYKFTDARIPDYTVPSATTFTGSAKPLLMADGTYRYLLPPSLPTIEGSYDEGNREFTITTSASHPLVGEYKRYKVDGAVETTKSYAIQRGDYLLADGNLLPKGTALTEEQKAKVAAIVFWTPAETDPTGRQIPASLSDDKIMAKDYPTCTHGLAVSVKNISAEMAWGDMSYGSVNDFQNSKEFNPADKTDYVSVAPKTGADGDINRILGYQNTKIMLAYNDYCKSSGKTHCIVKPVDALASFSNSNPAPRTSTGWFFSSAKELTILCNIDHDDIVHCYYNVYETKTIINKYLLVVGGELLNHEYWSSSEFDIGNAWPINFKDTYAGLYLVRKSASKAIRAVCAF